MLSQQCFSARVTRESHARECRSRICPFLLALELHLLVHCHLVLCGRQCSCWWRLSYSMAGPCWQLIEWYYRWSVLIWVHWRQLSKWHVWVHSHLVLSGCRLTLTLRQGRLVCGREGLSVVRIGFRQVFVGVRSLFLRRLEREREREERERPNFFVGGHMHLRSRAVEAGTRVSRALCGFHRGARERKRASERAREKARGREGGREGGRGRASDRREREREGGGKQRMQRAVWRGCRGRAPPPTSHCPTLDAADGCRAPTCAPPNLPPASAPTPRRLQTIRPPSPF